ncbi:MAG: Chromosome partition protein Smc [Acidimicrobiaceae bacterium]|nr:MAG: Chromosome partition protein Smc [Acidimicrobiaceae bacterium]
MFLKRLTIKGFKSFADPATLDLEPGVTAVVGPNGSGKSNVVDAVAWVLGAQAPSAVRSQRMDDVIFAGTTDRSALGRAEVSLTIDNSDSSLALDFPEITITRTLFRSGESDYSLNGSPCRLLDIQELLSDVGVGRQQHVIISQGQIDAVLNAREEDRRSIIEDAAGILKFRKRKEKAERRLDSTGANLDRLGDMQREVKRQLKPLERQADAARKHGDFLEELKSLRLFRLNKEFKELKSLASSESERRSDFTKQETLTVNELKSFESKISTAESELASRGEDDLGDQLVRFEALRERARGLKAVLLERQKGIERDRDTLVSSEVIAGLEVELIKAKKEEESLIEEKESLSPEVEALKQLEQELIDDWSTFKTDWADGVPMIGGRASEIRGELGVLRASVNQKESEKNQFQKKLNEVKNPETELNEKLSSLTLDLSSLRQENEALTESITRDKEALKRQINIRNKSWEDLAEAKANLRSTRIEIEALTQAIKSIGQTPADQQTLASKGSLGFLSDLIEIEPGYEKAFESTVEDFLSTIIFDTKENAIEALSKIDVESRSASVVVIDTRFEKLKVKNVGNQLRSHVSATDETLDLFLDQLLANVVVHEGGLDEIVETVVRNPEITVVNKTGDKFGFLGWRVGQKDQRNIKNILEDATSRLLLEETKVEEKQTIFSGNETRTQEMEDHLDETQKKFEECKRNESSLSESLQKIKVEQKANDLENQTIQDRINENDQRIKNETRQIAELQIRLEELEEAEKTSVQAAQRMTDERSRLESRSAETAARRTECEVRSADIQGRLAVVKARVSELDIRLEKLSGERKEVAGRSEIIEKKERATSFLINSLDSRTEIIEKRLTDLRIHRRDQSDRVREITSQLDELRSSRRKKEDEVRTLREKQSRLEIERAETRLKLENLTETMRSEFDREPNSIGELSDPELPDGSTVSERIAELERELKLIGPINPLALHEFDDLRERYEFLEEQLEDVRSTRKELRKVIRSIDIEIKEVFASAFAEVATNFNDLFEVLFPGGHGKLTLTDPENLLDTGIDIEARPSGKNVKKLSLLSGGERSLTALAFLFAVFRSRPSPFYVMDEVEAALDDANLFRFLGLVDQFRDESQLLIVSHQKRTMESADCLYGVSMASGGSSKVVSERVGATRSAERLGMLAS